MHREVAVVELTLEPNSLSLVRDTIGLLSQHFKYQCYQASPPVMTVIVFGDNKIQVHGLVRAINDGRLVLQGVKSAKLIEAPDRVESQPLRLVR